VIPRSLIRLVPAAISFLVTMALITLLGRQRYGDVSVLLATASLLNGLFFHCSRNVIVFRTLLDIPERALGDSWLVALGLSIVTLLGMTATHRIDLTMAALIFTYLACQSLFERELEYTRSSMHLRQYLRISCVRPLLSLAGVAVLYHFREADWLPRAAFLLIAITPLLACLPSAREVLRRIGPAGLASMRHAIALMPTGVTITLSLSYVFICDALIKLSLVGLVPPIVLGTYASATDLIMPACWVLAGAVAWDFVPSALKDKRHAQLLPLMARTAPLSALWLMALALTWHAEFQWHGITVHSRFYGLLGMANVASACLSSLVFPALIIQGRRYAALVCATAGILLNVLMLHGVLPALTRWLEPATSVSAIIVVAQSAIILAASCLVLKNRAVGQAPATTTRS
jgi:hypothetical protein